MNMCYTKFTVLFFWVFLGSASLRAQQVSPRQWADQQNAWFFYLGDHKISDRWGVHLEGQVRRAEVIRKWQQLLLRGGVNWHPHEKAFFTLGYAIVDTHPYGEFPVAYRFPEHRIYQQLQMRDVIGIFEFQHRFRLEQRWLATGGIGELDPGAWRYFNRARYFFRTTVPLQGKTIDDKEFFLSAYDEVFVSFGEQVQGNVFDQNRLYFVLGYRFGKAGRIEAGYLNQCLAKTDGKRYERNHTLQVGWFSNAPFYKNKNVPDKK